KEGQRNYYFQLEVTQRNRPGKTLSTGGDCFPGDGVIHCNVDCDGGGIQVKWRDKPESILIDLAATGRIRLGDCGGEENAVDLARRGRSDVPAGAARARGVSPIRDVVSPLFASF